MEDELRNFMYEMRSYLSTIENRLVNVENQTNYVYVLHNELLQTTQSVQTLGQSTQALFGMIENLQRQIMDAEMNRDSYEQSFEEVKNHVAAVLESVHATQELIFSLETPQRGFKTNYNSTSSY